MDPGQVGIDTLDLYYVLVEIIFGTVLLAGLAVIVILILIGALSKMSPLLIIFIIVGFAIHFGIGFGGAIFAVLGMILGMVYFSVGMFNYFNKMSTATQ